MKQIQKYYQDSDRELSRRYLGDRYPELNLEFFEAARKHRYALYPHILDVADFQSFKGKDVLEIGVGHGTDHAMFGLSGARVFGVDLTRKHCEMTRLCLDSFGTQSRLSQANALKLPYRAHSFDHVYSCGVLLLIADIHEAINEIHRVLKPGGSITIMMYNQASIHYWVKTRWYYGWVLGEDKVLGKETVNDWYTDGIHYPKVYYCHPRDLMKLLKQFSKIEYRTECLTSEQIPLVGLPTNNKVTKWLEAHFGFFLWVRAWV